MFIRKYWIPLLVFSIAIVGVGLYLLTIQQLPEPIVIIKPVEPIGESTAEKPPVETEAPSDTSQGGHWHGDVWHATEPHRPDDLLTMRYETPDPEVTTGESLPADASLTQLKALKEKIDDINDRIQAKYPEFEELATLTPEEIAARYPTERDVLAFVQRVEDFIQEFLHEIRNVFADAPIELREGAYDIVYKQLVHSWGAESADESMEILRGTVE